MPYKFRNEAGFSLIELLVVTFLAACSLYVCLNYFLQSKLAWHERQARLQRQEQANIILGTLRFDIMHAGYIGCPKLTEQFAIQPVGQHLLTANNRINGTQSTLNCRYASLKMAYLAKVTTNSLHLSLSKDAIFHPNEWLLISDCRVAEVNQVQKVHRLSDYQHLKLTKAITTPLSRDTEVAKLVIHTYSYIAESKTIYLQPLPGEKIKLSTQFTLHFHYYYQKDGHLHYIHDTSQLPQSSLIGVAIRLKAKEGRDEWFDYVSV